MKDNSDGFVIAEKDLLLRGPGDFFGFQQSGLKYSGLRAGSLIPHIGLLKDAHKMASSIYSNEYTLPYEDEKIQSLLSLFPAPTSSPSVVPSASTSSPSSSTSTLKKTKVDKKFDLNDIEPLSPKSVKSKSSNPDGMYVDFLLHNTGTDTSDENNLEPVVVLFDLETSGLRPRWGDKIIQLGAKVLNDENKGNFFDCYIKTPNLRISSEITMLTNISQYDHDTKGRPFQAVWADFIVWLKNMSRTDSGNRPIVLIAHNGANFDIPFLNYEVQYNGISNIEGDWMKDSNVVCFVDSVRLLRDDRIWTERRELLGINMINDRPKSKALGSIYKYIFNDNVVDAHSAMGDVIALEAILESKGLKEIWRKYANKIQFTSV